MVTVRLETWVHAVWSLLILLLAIVTVYEKIYGTEQVQEHIYGAGWLAACWGVAGLLSLLWIFRRHLYRQKAVFLLHIAFGLILLGAFITWVAADRGFLHLRQGESCASYFSGSSEKEQPLPFEVRLVQFDIEYHPGSSEPAGFINFLHINDKIYRVSMNRIHSQQGYRLYPYAYDPDGMGSLLQVSYDPWGIGITYTGYLLLVVCMVWVLFLRIGWKGMLVTGISVAALGYCMSRLNPMTPVLRTPMLAAHVSGILISYLLLVVICVLSVAGVSSARWCKKLYQINRLLLFPAVFLLAAGIFIGAVWANISWRRY